MSTIRRALILAVVVMSGVEASQAGERPVSFVRDIMPMLTRLGCNTTACHNALTGKGGLNLSPLGSDFEHKALDPHDLPVPVGIGGLREHPHWQSQWHTGNRATCAIRPLNSSNELLDAVQLVTRTQQY
jgi:hypothetical protein